MSELVLFLGRWKYPLHGKIFSLDDSEPLQNASLNCPFWGRGHYKKVFFKSPVSYGFSHGFLFTQRVMISMQIGPLRCWPGGLCLSRSIGDRDVGEFIVPVPYVKQVKVSCFYLVDNFIPRT